MTMMGDNRECAKAVSAALTPGSKPGPKVHERQTYEIPRAFLFGHYDSRGGATLVAARHLIEAFEKYATTAFGWTKSDNGELDDLGMKEHFKTHGGDYEAWKPDALHELLEGDYMFSCHAIFLDAEPGDEQELDESFDDDGYKYGLLQYRWLHKSYSEDPEEQKQLSKWTNVGGDCKKTLVFWKGKKPTIDPAVVGMNYLTGLEVRIAKKSYGEDASGVTLIK